MTHDALQGGAMLHSMIRRLPAWPARSLAVLLLGVPACVAGAVADEAANCADINLGRLDVALASDSAVVRTVAMAEGDTLAFTFRADAQATGSVTFIAADGREQLLLYGPHATHATYTAESAGPVEFRLARRGGRVATFLATCSPAYGPEVLAPDGLTIDVSAPVLLPAGGASAAKGGKAGDAVAPGEPALQWLGGVQSETAAATGAYGLNLKVQPALMVGVLAQFDQASNSLLGPSALSEQHWLAGPTMSMLLATGLSLDAHAAWGPADPVTGQTVSRQTFDARLASTQEAGPWRFSPSISYAHVEAKGAAPDVPGQQTVESDRIEVRPEMAYRIDMGSMYIEPKVMVGTFWSLSDEAIGSQRDPRAMAETGITFGAPDGTQLQLGGAVEEGEKRSESVWSGKVQVTVPLK